MKKLLASLCLTVCVAGALAGGPAIAQTKPIRLGVLNDMSGVYADYQGIGSVVAAQMAVAEFGGKVGSTPIEVLSADHQNKPDNGAAIARKWFDIDCVDVILDVPNSAVAFAVADVARDKNKMFIASGAGSSEMTGARCSPNTVAWTYDTWELGHALGRAVMACGGKKWFFITADYAFGSDLQNQAADQVTKGGGTIAGAVRHPLGTADFPSYLVQAQSSGADVMALANAGGDTVVGIKQATEFGINKTMTIVGPIVNINVIQETGLKAATGVLALTPFYWDMNDDIRAFAARFQAAHPRHIMPNDMQAGVDAAVTHYFKAVQALGSAANGRAVTAEMKKLPTDDKLFGRGTIRPDGRKLHPVYLYQTKTEAESKGPWDMFKLLSIVPAEEAFRRMADGKCAMVGG